MLDRKKAPEIKEIDTVSLPTAEVTQLQNGARLHIINNETQPVIRLDFVFKAGKWYESAPGVSDLASKMLLEGSQNYTAKQIAETVAYYGASFENNHGYDRTEFTLYTLSKHLPKLLPVIIDVLQNPVFPEPEFDLLKQRNQQNLKVQRQKNNYLATHSFTKLIYGQEHPYIYGFDADALDGIALNELEKFFKVHFSTLELQVFACGALDKDNSQLLIRELEQLNLAGEQKHKNEVTLSANSAVKSDFVTVEDSLQSSIRMGILFPRIGEPSYHKLVILSEILGGYFGSRLMRNIREDKGYTYGIFSTISPKEKDSLFYIGTDVDYNVTENTVEEIRKEIKLLQDEFVPDDELNTVKSYMLGKFLNDITTVFDQCERYKRIVLSTLPAEHYNSYIKTIKSITQEEIRELANTYLDLNKMSLAIAGKRSDV